VIIWILAVLIGLFAYSVPGFVLARGMYAEQLREIRQKPVVVVPPQPPRPRIKLTEMLHVSGSYGSTIGRCSILDSAKRACNCRYRDEWIELKNGWTDYNEWHQKYGRITNGVVSEPTVNMTPIYLAVPGWPIVAGSMFIKGGAKGIPDYRAIERMENEFKELA